MKLFIVGLLGVCVAVAAAASSCSTTVCGASDQCCNDAYHGPQCYNPSTSDCVGGAKLCGKGEGACGSTCFNQSSYMCTPSGELVQGGSSGSLFCSPFIITPCGPGQYCCEDTCYNPTEFDCLNYFLCPKGFSICGDGQYQCYNPEESECCNNRIYAKGASLCSQQGTSCCSCSCAAPYTTSFPQESFTVASADQCTSQFITSSFGPLVCPGTGGGCTGESQCNVSCGNYQFIENFCFGTEEGGCDGHYLCTGGSFSCSISSSGDCVVDVKNTGSSTTTTPSGTTSFEVVPADYEGEVCCWCATKSGEQAIDTPVPSVADCTPSFVAANVSFIFPDTECRVFSTFTPFTATGPRIACGIPE